MNIEAMELELNKAGYFLRDDNELRKDDPYFAGRESAYSLHTVKPFERHAVYAGSKRWAVLQACIKVFGYRTPWEVRYDKRCSEWQSGRPYIVAVDGKLVAMMQQFVGHPGEYDFMADLIANQIVHAVNQVENMK